MTATPLKRVLAVVRLSNETDETTSPDRQRAIIRNWAQANGHVIAGVVEDLDVSGKTDPFERPGLGPWLATPERFDIIAVWKLDRLSRNVIHFARLMEWAEAGRKAIVSVTEGLDLSTPMGKMFAHIIAAFAQAELETITERITAGHAAMRQAGRYAGAPWPFGYVPANLPGGGRTLAQEPVYAQLLREIIQGVTEGVSTHEIARQLNKRRVRTWGWRRAQLSGRVMRTKGGKVDLKKQHWTSDVIQQVVKSPSCCGWKVQKLKSEDGRYLRHNEPVLDEEGAPIKATDQPIVSPAEWKAAVAAMSSRASRTGRSSGTENMLQGVIICASCGGNLYHQSQVRQLKGGPRRFSYYRCQARRKGRECAHPAAVEVEAAEAQVTAQLLALLDDAPILRTEYDPGEDYSAEIAQARARLDELEEDYLAGKYDGPEAKARYHRLHAKASERVDRLLALPQRPAATRRVATGETYSQRWEAMDDRETKRSFLAANGFRVFAAAAGQSCHKDGLCDPWVCMPDDHMPTGLQPPLSHSCEHAEGETLKTAHVRLEIPPSIWAVEDDGQRETWSFDTQGTAGLGWTLGG